MLELREGQAEFDQSLVLMSRVRLQRRLYIICVLKLYLEWVFMEEVPSNHASSHNIARYSGTFQNYAIFMRLKNHVLHKYNVIG